MSNQPTTFLAIGDVHGNWSRVIEAINSATELLGQVPDMVLKVGDAEVLRNENDLELVAGPRKHKWLGEFSKLRVSDLAVTACSRQ